MRNTEYAIRNTGYYSRLVMQRAEALGGVSEEANCLVRRFATPAMAAVNALVGGWMQAAGMAVHRNNVGNLIGRYEAAAVGASTLILGSHLDTVRDAGKYDGPLGVLVAIACVEALHDEGKRLPFAIEVVGFADEEGLRYGTAYLGSKAFAGTFDAGYLELVDSDGISAAAAIRAFGGEPALLNADKRRSEDLLGYCEVHIEQGPVLEREGLPVGIVSAIAGQTRCRITFHGESGHAGTVPMDMRRDALCAAAEFVLAAEALARSEANIQSDGVGAGPRACPAGSRESALEEGRHGGLPLHEYLQSESGLVVTVGQLAVQPGASNVIPGQVSASLDIRHSDDAIRQQAHSQLHKHATDICARRSISLDWQMLQDTNAVLCSKPLAEKLAHAIEAAGYPARWLPSGAGHDAVIMSVLCPMAMLFVRCKGGVSHNPDESVDVKDVAVAIEVMSRFLETLI